MRSAAMLLVAASVLACTAAQPPKPDPGKPLIFTGRVEAVAVEVRPRVTGYVEKVAVRDGETVKKGNLLAEIDSRPLKAEADSARAKIGVAEAQFNLAKANHARTRAAFDRAAVSKEEFQRSEAELALAEAMRALAKAEQERAEFLLSLTRVTAPIGGRVSRFAVTTGNLVKADDTVLATVVRPDPVFVAFDVDESAFLKLRQEAKDRKPVAAVGFLTDDGFPHAAALDLADSAIDPKTGTVRVRVTLANPKGDILPGQSARVRLSAK